MTALAQHDRRRSVSSGFTLIELLVVVAVIAILALIALPSTQQPLVREQVVQAARWSDFAKARVAAAWLVSAKMPADNAAAGLPAPDRNVSTLVSSVTVEGGALHIVFGNSANNALKGKTLTLRPAIVADAPMVPVSWLCAHAPVPPNMTAQGPDRTDIAAQFLPINCR